MLMPQIFSTKRWNPLSQRQSQPEGKSNNIYVKLVLPFFIFWLNLLIWQILSFTIYIIDLIII